MCEGNHLSDLTEDSHTQQAEPLKNVVKVSLLYLGQNIKPSTSYGFRAKLEILQKNILLDFQSVESNSQSIEPDRITQWILQQLDSNFT